MGFLCGRAAQNATDLHFLILKGIICFSAKIFVMGTLKREPNYMPSVIKFYFWVRVEFTVDRIRCACIKI